MIQTRNSNRKRVKMIIEISSKLFIGFLTLALGCAAYLYIKNGRIAFTPKRKFFTQLTDNEAFRHICHWAALSPEVFSQFKRDPIYTLFCENLTEEQGKEVHSYLEINAPQLLEMEQIEKFRLQDYIGNPMTYTFDKIGEFSPSTLFAIKVAHDLEKHFGSLHNFKVVEIGAHHGTQCKILQDLFPGIDYTIVDLPESLELSKKVLDTLGVSSVRFLTPDQLDSTQQVDLVLSNYAFTESNARQQQRYFNSLFRRAKRGYLTCNFFPKHFRVKPWKKEDLLKKFDKILVRTEVLPEIPQTGKENFILIWK